jgi:hypothetical protein
MPDQLSSAPRILVVLSDALPSRVDVGTTLGNFLGLWQPRACEVISTEALLQGPIRRPDLALIGLPSRFGPQHADRLKAARTVTFDYFDAPEPFWDESDRVLLRSISMCHLKTHRIQGRDQGIPIGLLPIRYNKAVTTVALAYRASRPWRAIQRLAGRIDRPWDVSLQGSTTYLDKRTSDGGVERYEQRVEWMTELRSNAAWRSWGGLLPIPYRTEADVVREHGPHAAALFAPGPRIPFGRYFRLMTRTKVALCPAGHARWTYRHVESVYAGCDVVSTDLSGIDTLVPIPLASFSLVPDRAAITPAVTAALHEWPERAHRRLAAYEALEEWLFGGRFARVRRRPYERFLRQFA